MAGEMENSNGDNGSAQNGGHKRRKPPFQLCFPSTHEQGRSEMSKPKLPRHSYLITPKFYSSVQTLIPPEDPIILQLTDEIKTLRNEGPKEKFQEPVVESHSYGWYHEPLIPMDKNDRRFNHHRMTSDMVKVQCILHNASQAEKQFEKLLLSKVKQE